MQIQHANRRSWINLETANKSQAAVEARRLYEELRANGWEETLRRRKPDAGAKKVNLTISEYLEAVKVRSAIYSKTIESYGASLRKIAADIHGLAETGEKKSPVNRGAWRAKVGAIKLRTLTAEKIENWRIDFIRRKGTDPVREKSAKGYRQTVSSVVLGRSSALMLLRGSKTLWSFPIPFPLPA